MIFEGYCLARGHIAIANNYIHRMKPEMLQSIERRFADVEQEKMLVLATMMDPGFKDKFFSDAVNRQNAKTIYCQINV